MSDNDDTKLHDLKEFLDAINTPGGHIMFCFIVGTIGVTLGLLLTYLAWPDEKLAMLLIGITGAMTGFWQVATYAMQGRDKANGKTIIVTHSDTQERTETPTPKE